MIILGIETSCDETALSLIEAHTNERSGTNQIRLIADALISQIKVHEPYGGVFPVIAKREHSKNLLPLLYKILGEAKLDEVPLEPFEDKIEKMRTLLDRENELLPLWKIFLMDCAKKQTKPVIDAIAVTQGPGLEPALWVGISFAKALGMLWDIPVIPTNHMEGHILASLLHSESHKGIMTAIHAPALPAMSLLVSGGHTELVLVEKLGSYKIVGKTRDDAVGEAFDKVARLLGLPYPGGPQISKLAAEGRANKNKAGKTNGDKKDGSSDSTETFSCTLPRPMIHSKDLDFSFSGLKTAVLYLTRDLKDPVKNPETKGAITDQLRAEIAREFEGAVTEVLVKKTAAAIEQTAAQSLIVGGGVSANTHLCQALKKLAESLNIRIYLPESKLSTDNAIMIAIAGFLQTVDSRDFGYPEPETIVAKGNATFLS